MTSHGSHPNPTANPSSNPNQDESESESDDGAVARGGGVAPGGEGAAAHGVAGGARGGGRVREEVTFELFERWLWPHMVAKTKPEAALGGHSVAELRRQATVLRTAKGGRRTGMEPSIVFREIVSFIKGWPSPSPSPQLKPEP